jgi:hypothetical protein
VRVAGSGRSRSINGETSAYMKFEQLADHVVIQATAVNKRTG